MSDVAEAIGGMRRDIRDLLERKLDDTINMGGSICDLLERSDSKLDDISSKLERREDTGSTYKLGIAGQLDDLNHSLRTFESGGDLDRTIGGMYHAVGPGLKDINYSLSEIHNRLTLLHFHCFLFGILASAGIIAIIGTLRHWF
jgi:hypothetical protein